MFVYYPAHVQVSMSTNLYTVNVKQQVFAFIFQHYCV